MSNINDYSHINSTISETISLFRDLLHALLRSSFPAWVNLQLTLPQLRTFFVIAHFHPSSVVNIAQQLGIGEPTASHLVDKLVLAGLVERSEDPRDRRRARIQLSQEGKYLIDRLLGWEVFLGDWLLHIPQKDLSLIRDSLNVLIAEADARSVNIKQEFSDGEIPLL